MAHMAHRARAKDDPLSVTHRIIMNSEVSAKVNLLTTRVLNNKYLTAFVYISMGIVANSLKGGKVLNYNYNYNFVTPINICI